jgi:DNA polymerase theta
MHKMQSVGNRVGLVEQFLMRMARGAPMCTSNQSRSSTMMSDDQTLRVCKRFNVALILSRLVQVTF